MRDSGHGRGFFRPWVRNGSDNALNLLAEAAEIRSGDSVLRPNVGNFALSGGCAQNSQTHQPFNPRLMDIGTDPNLHSDDVHMADQDDLHHAFSSLEGFDLESAIAGVENDTLGIDDIMFNFECSILISKLFNQVVLMTSSKIRVAEQINMLIVSEKFVSSTKMPANLWISH